MFTAIPNVVEGVFLIHPAEKGETSLKIISAKEAAEKIKDGDTIAVTSLNLGSFPEEIMVAIEERYLQTHEPKDVTLLGSTGMGNGKDGNGMDYLAHEGLTKRVIAGYIAHSPRMARWVAEGKVEGYLYPQGQLLHLYRAIANHYPGVISKVGLHTFVDPRLEGARANTETTEELIELLEIDGEEYLRYKPFPIDVGLIRGTYADTKGNIVVTQEANIMELFSLSAAAHNSGGTVIAQVKEVVEAGQLDPKSIVVPGTLVDYVVVNEQAVYHKQTATTHYSPSISGELKTTGSGRKPMPLSIRKIIARRSAAFLDPQTTVNLGVGMADGVAHIVQEEGCSEEIQLTIDTGIFGGTSALGIDFGTSYNPEAIIAHDNMFDFYNGGGLDAAFLGLAQVDKYGNVNVSKFGKKLTGPGGFIGITQNTPKLVFMGKMMVGADYQIEDKKLVITKEGTASKFVEEVEQVTFSGEYAGKSGQEIYFVTERGVFDMEGGKLRLIEVAPGLDIEQDITRHIAFDVTIASDVQIMDPDIFQDKWGKLNELLKKKKG